MPFPLWAVVAPGTVKQGGVGETGGGFGSGTLREKAFLDEHNGNSMLLGGVMSGDKGTHREKLPASACLPLGCSSVGHKSRQDIKACLFVSVSLSLPL